MVNTSITPPAWNHGSDLRRICCRYPPWALKIFAPAVMVVLLTAVLGSSALGPRGPSRLTKSKVRIFRPNSANKISSTAETLERARWLEFLFLAAQPQPQYRRLSRLLNRRLPFPNCESGLELIIRRGRASRGPCVWREPSVFVPDLYSEFKQAGDA